MVRETCVTTSWDDGHPLDLRVAALLNKYALRGTFYVPMRSENQTMTNSQLRELSTGFEVGAHTLAHTVLTSVSPATAWEEIAGGRRWLQDTLGGQCSMFCPPGGKFSAQHIGMVQRAGFLGLRTVGLLSLEFPRVVRGVAVMETTCQAFPHPATTYFKNAVKRRKYSALWEHVRSGCPRDWVTIARQLLERAIRRGGVFHLWGHSWELEESSQWQRLEEVLRLMSEVCPPEQAVTNGQLCEWPVSDTAPAVTTRRKPDISCKVD
jgi:peptidoglycan/xylan/chitin deacetylase (PgdA/CDA1 family)